MQRDALMCRDCGRPMADMTTIADRQPRFECLNPQCRKPLLERAMGLQAAAQQAAALVVPRRE